MTSIRSLNRAELARIALLVALGVLLVGLPVPIPIRALFDLGILGAAALVTLLGLSRGTPMQLARIGFLSMLALYVILLLHPNLPSLSTGLEGIRYTMVSIAGLMLGLALPDLKGDRPIRLIPAITILLLASAALSLAIHLLAPGIESSFDRTADITTATLGGEPRMQGLLSGPFHVSMLGAFLTIAGLWLLMLRRPIGGLPAVIGGAVLLLAKVRTGLITAVIGLIALVFLAFYLRRSQPALFSRLHLNGKRAVAVAGMVLVGIGALFVVAGDNIAVQQIRDLPTDHRVASRIDSIEAAVDLSLDSPIKGWGPGASASGLKHEFWDADKAQINPHSGALGLTVEAGIGALFYFLLIAIPALVNLFREIGRKRQVEASGIAVAAALPVAAFWLIGDGLAALPIALALTLIIGVFIGNGLETPDDGRDPS